MKEIKCPYYSEWVDCNDCSICKKFDDCDFKVRSTFTVKLLILTLLIAIFLILSAIIYQAGEAIDAITRSF